MNGPARDRGCGCASAAAGVRGRVRLTTVIESADRIRRTIRKLTSEMTTISRNSVHAIAEA